MLKLEPMKLAIQQSGSRIHNLNTTLNCSTRPPEDAAASIYMEKCGAFCHPMGCKLVMV